MDRFGLFDPSGFPARWHCGTWSAALGWTHILADVAIFGAYLSIPLVIAHYVRQRRPKSFSLLYVLFGAFILSCGLGHLIEATIFWVPVYRLAGAVKVVTAISSWVTVGALVQEFPKAMRLPEAARLAEELELQVAERTRAEEEVRRLNASLERRLEELRALLQVLPVGVAIVDDPECTQIVANAAFRTLLRIPVDAPVSCARIDEVPLYADGQRLERGDSLFRSAIRDQRAVTNQDIEVRFDAEDVTHLLVSVVPVVADGVARGAVGAFVDITAVRQAERVERRLREAQKLESLGLMAGGIAHDFNNLLLGVLGNVSVARSGLPPDSTAHEPLEQAESAGQRAAELCSQMLAYSGRGQFVMQDLDLSGLVREAARLLHSAHPRAVLVFRLQPDLPVVTADIDQIRQLLLNLLLNAAEALPDGRGRITLGTGRADLDAATDEDGRPLLGGPHVFVEVSDDGGGMDDQVRTRMFEPFFTTKFTGRGLGLAAVLGIVRGHAGRIEVESAPDRGTRVRVLLPAASAATRREASTPAAAPQRWRGEGIALIVDDEPAVRRAAGRMMQALGFDVWSANDGEDAVQRFASELDQVKVVVLDLTMPRLNGGETLAALRARRGDLPVLLTTGYTHHDVAGHGVGDGRTAFLEKPYTMQQLRDALSALLR